MNNIRHPLRYNSHSTVQWAEGVASCHVPTLQQLLQALLMPCDTSDRVMNDR